MDHFYNKLSFNGKDLCIILIIVSGLFIISFLVYRIVLTVNSHIKDNKNEIHTIRKDIKELKEELMDEQLSTNEK